MRSETYSESKTIAARQNRAERDYWLNKLSGEMAKNHFPYDNKKTSANIDKRGAVAFSLPRDTSSRLIEISNRFDPGLHMVFLAGIILLINKYTGDKDIVVGAPVLKQDIDVDFVNTILVLRNRVSAEMTFKEFLLRVRQTVIGASENQNYPIDTLLYKLDREYKENDFPLFDIAVLLKNIHCKSYLHPVTPNMIFSFFRTEECIEGEIEYNTLLYKRSTVNKIIGHLKNGLQTAIFNPDMKTADITILSPEEKKRLLFDFNDNKTALPKDEMLHHIIEKKAEINPGRIAAVYEETELTYRELNEKSNRLARMLRDYGTRENTLVGILMNRSHLMMIAILAAWKAGGAYIPVDPASPVERLRHFFADSRVTVLLTQPGYIEDLPFKHDSRIVFLEEENDVFHNGPCENPEPVNRPADIAYVIYTSGSTGAPKGAAVEHQGMMNHIRAKINDLQMTEKSIIAQNASHCFDISVWQFFSASACGGRTVIYGSDRVADAGLLISHIVKDKITILEVVPSYLAIMLDISLSGAGGAGLCLDYLLVTGEEVKPELLTRWFAVYPGIKVVNAYGPTEASDDITHHVLDKAPGPGRVPIGKPVENLNIYIVDDHMNICPVGVKGEICVSGVGIGRGYLNDVDKTARVFGEDPFIGRSGVRLYKTGDLGRWLEDGSIDFLGRKDYQVKIRGFRIELGEIENRLAKYPAIKDAVVLPKNKGGYKYLCAYIVPRQLKEPAPSLNDYLNKHLPGYMIPSYFVELDNIPLTANGKTDKNALPEPELRQEEEYVPPGNEVEEKLAGIWSEILDIEKERIGMNRDFFELGGHSLNVLQVISKIKKELNFELTVEQMYTKTNIKEIAAEILKKDACDQLNTNWLLFNGDNERTIFCFPPQIAHALSYREFSSFLTEHSIFSFNFINDSSLNEYVSEIIESRAEGPYILLGYSSGALLAFNVAKKMETLGHKISDVIILDNSFNVKNEIFSEEAGWFTDFWEEILRIIDELKISFMKDAVYERYRDYMQYISTIKPLGKIDAHIHLIRSSYEYSQEEIMEYKKRKISWESLTGKKVTVYKGFGNHEQMFRDDYLARNTEIVRNILNDIEGE